MSNRDETRVSVQEFRAKLADWLKRARAGERVVVCRDGMPVAELLPYRRNV